MSWLNVIIYGPLFLVGIGFLVAAWYTDPTALTDDGYNLKNFFYLMGGGFIIFPLLTMIGLWWWQYKQYRQLKWFKENGLKGVGTILAMSMTGTEINDSPVINIKLKVKVMGRSEYELEKREWVDLLTLNSLKKGIDLPVLVDPNSQNKLLIDWENYNS